jgi:hypothetical protein
MEANHCATSQNLTGSFGTSAFTPLECILPNPMTGNGILKAQKLDVSIFDDVEFNEIFRFPVPVLHTKDLSYNSVGPKLLKLFEAPNGGFLGPRRGFFVPPHFCGATVARYLPGTIVHTRSESFIFTTFSSI